MCYPIKLLKKLKDLDADNKLDFTQINKAIYWARKYHHGQFRKSGEPFYTHPLEVAYLVADYLLKTDVIVASILHDIVEDTEVTAGMILDSFGHRIEEIVDRLTRDRPDGSKLSVEEILNNAYENDDKEVLLIKVIDRLHNMRTIGVKTPNKQIKEATETLNQFIALSMYIENIKLEQTISHLCHQISSSQKQIKKMDYIYSFLKQEDNYQLPSLSL